LGRGVAEEGGALGRWWRVVGRHGCCGACVLMRLRIVAALCWFGRMSVYVYAKLTKVASASIELSA
jgi:hypothetical protein